MQPHRVLLADDEPPARKRLRELFAREPDFIVARECADGEECVRVLAEQSFELLLLDVQMPGCSGLDVVRTVGPTRLPPVVFVTAFDEHAVRAFELHALDYLLKPFDRERFQDMLARARREIARSSNAYVQRLEDLLAEVGRRESPLVFRSRGRTVLVDPREVEWIAAAGNYLRLHGAGTVRLVRGPLSAMEELLASRGFLRAHRSLLVNEKAVREVLPRKSGELTLVLASGTRLVSGRSYRHSIQAHFRGTE